MAYAPRAMPDTRMRPSTALFAALTIAFVVAGVWETARWAFLDGCISFAVALVPLAAAWALMNADGPESF
jgi:hypothetical protein